MSSALKVQLQGKPTVGMTSGFHSQELASGLSTLNSQAGTYRHSYRQEGTMTCQAAQTYHIRNASYVHFVPSISNLVVSYPESRMSSNDSSPSPGFKADEMLTCQNKHADIPPRAGAEAEHLLGTFWKHQIYLEI